MVVTIVQDILEHIAPDLTRKEVHRKAKLVLERIIGQSSDEKGVKNIMDELGGLHALFSLAGAKISNRVKPNRYVK